MEQEVRGLARPDKEIPYVTAALVILNVIVFLICTFTGDLLYNKGSVSVIYLMHGQWYRMITSMFLHADINHLVSNMLLLGGLGSMLEPVTGHWRLGVFYFLTGICGNGLSAIHELATGRFAESVGASGAVFGLLGVLLAMVVLAGKRVAQITLPRMLFVIALSLYGGFTAENVDNAAHIGGLLAGCLTGTVSGVARRIQQRIKGRKK